MIPLPTTVVPIKSAWYSKINWTQAAGVAASVATIVTGHNIQLTPEVITGAVTAIQGVTAVATWIMRTWFNGTVSLASLPK